MQILKLVLSLLLLLIPFNFFSQKRDVTIEAQQISGKIYMLKGYGGNIGLSIGEDGVFVIDDQFAHLTQKIDSVIKTLSDKPLKFLVNTHYHGDHTGGNENMANLGATIISHDNVRKRLEANPTRKGTMLPKEALPVITFNDALSLHINGEKVLVFHVENAHTDGDVMLYFTQSNVLHSGDIFFNGLYPYIDLAAGGSVDGYIKAIKRALIVINDDTKIIPGHGESSNAEEYRSFLNMMEDLKTIIQKEIEKGKSEEEVAANSSLTKTYDDLGFSWSFINSEKIRRTFYKSLKE